MEKITHFSLNKIKSYIIHWLKRYMILIWNHIYPGPSCMGCPKCARLWAFHFNWSQLNQLEGFPTESPSHDQCNFFSCQHIRCFRQFLSFSLPFSLLLYDKICRRGSNQRRWTPPPHYELEKMSSHIRCCLRRSLGPLKMFSLGFTSEIYQEMLSGCLLYEF